MSKKIIVITGASSGFGRLTTNALAKAGHAVYASMRDTAGRNAPQAADEKKFAQDNTVDLRPIELDVSSEKSIDPAIRRSSPNKAGSTFSCTMPGIWCSARRKRLHPSNWPRFTTSMYSAPKG